MRTLHVGTSPSVALQTIFGLALGITQVLPKRSSAATARTIYEQCRADDIWLLSVSTAASSALSSVEAASLRQLTHIRIDHGSVEESASLIAALSGYCESPLTNVHHDADAAIGVSSQMAKPHWGRTQ
jgi:hypothetical protein